jgi:phthalate 4,5-cis-dihydrodiol dehydrogenase
LDSGHLRIGVAGLGSAAREILGTVDGLDGFSLTAVADVRPEALDLARKAYPGVEAYESVADLSGSPNVDAVWIATPNDFHAAHTIAAASRGKHVICEKPMAITLAECDEMVRVVEESGVVYVQGHSKLHEPVLREMGDLISGGTLGRVLQVWSVNSNDWLRRPRLESELDRERGGGVLYRQGPHQLDIVRFLGGGVVESVAGRVGQGASWTVADGDYSAFLQFAGGGIGIAGFNGYGHFDAAELTWGIGESGTRKAKLGQGLQVPKSSAPVAADVKYAWSDSRAREHAVRQRDFQPFFGLTVVSCERGTVRQSERGIYVYTDYERSERVVARALGRRGELFELQRAIQLGVPAFPGAEWGRATVATCLAIFESSRDGAPVRPSCQVASPAGTTRPEFT